MFMLHLWVQKDKTSVKRNSQMREREEKKQNLSDRVFCYHSSWQCQSSMKSEFPSFCLLGSKENDPFTHNYHFRNVT